VKKDCLNKKGSDPFGFYYNHTFYFKILFWGFLFFPFISIAQSIKISGYVKDSLSGECLIGAVIYSDSIQNHAITNNYGFFNLIVPQKKSVNISFVGYKNYKIADLVKDTVILVNLTTDNQIEIVDVYCNSNNRNYTGVATLSSKIAEKIPSIMGEKDILKGFQTLPGVQGGVEATSGLNIRGGSPDQNLILIDGIPVYNVNHLFGLFSVFNADAINSATLYKGYMPSKYGGRLSSVIDITLKEGNQEKLCGKASIGLLSSMILIEGPIIKNKTSFLISARRTYIDLLTRPIIKSVADGALVGYYFYDVNAKINHQLSLKDHIFMSFYTGKDKYFSEKDENGYLRENGSYHSVANDDLNWGNITSAIRWNHISQNNLFSNLSVTASRFKLTTSQYSLDEKFWGNEVVKNEYQFRFYSGITDYSLLWNLSYIPMGKIKIEGGVSSTYHIFSPSINGNSFGKIEDLTKSDSTDKTIKVIGIETSGYLNAEASISRSLSVYGGLRISSFTVEKENYFGIEPRLNLVFSINDNASLSASYNRSVQYIHLLTNSYIGLPTDMWVPTTSKIKPSNSDQFSLSFATNKRNNYPIVIDLYYKDMNNLTEFKEGASFLNKGEEWFNKVEQGVGRSYGLEMQVEKKKGKLNGWISYTLSKSDRQFSTINQGEPFPYKYDRRHYLNVVGFYRENERFDYGFNWIFSSGSRFTLITEKYSTATDDYFKSFFAGSNIDQGSVDYFDERNGFSMPYYHRLDIGFNFHKQKKKYKRTWSLGAYNVYWKKNPLYIQSIEGGYRGISILPIVPYFSYNIEF